jgi:hypothetical protein
MRGLRLLLRCSSHNTAAYLAGRFSVAYAYRASIFCPGVVSVRGWDGSTTFIQENEACWATIVSLNVKIPVQRWHSDLTLADLATVICERLGASPEQLHSPSQSRNLWRHARASQRRSLRTHLHLQRRRQIPESQSLRFRAA